MSLGFAEALMLTAGGGLLRPAVPPPTAQMEDAVIPGASSKKLGSDAAKAAAAVKGGYSKAVPGYIPRPKPKPATKSAARAKISEDLSKPTQFDQNAKAVNDLAEVPSVAETTQGNPISIGGNKNYRVSSDELTARRGGKLIPGGMLIKVKTLQEALSSGDEVQRRKAESAKEATAAVRAVRRDKKAVEAFLRNLMTDGDSAAANVQQQLNDRAGLEAIVQVGGKPEAADREEENEETNWGGLFLRPVT